MPSALLNLNSLGCLMYFSQLFHLFSPNALLFLKNCAVSSMYPGAVVPVWSEFPANSLGSNDLLEVKEGSEGTTELAECFPTPCVALDT